MAFPGMDGGTAGDDGHDGAEHALGHDALRTASVDESTPGHSGILFHLLEAEAADEAALRPYAPESLVREGFIHCCGSPEVLLEVANRFYARRPGAFVVLVVDARGLEARLVWEGAAHPDGSQDADSRVFPHIYGPIERRAILQIVPISRLDDGTFVVFEPGTFPSTSDIPA
jgi:uncharacterized protein (DUF952 family)